jgi:hypothetical protein
VLTHHLYGLYAVRNGERCNRSHRLWQTAAAASGNIPIVRNSDIDSRKFFRWTTIYQSRFEYERGDAASARPLRNFRAFALPRQEPESTVGAHDSRVLVLLSGIRKNCERGRADVANQTTAALQLHRCRLPLVPARRFQPWALYPSEPRAAWQSREARRHGVTLKRRVVPVLSLFDG